MKPLKTGIYALSLISLSVACQANAEASYAKPFSVGIGSYALIVSADESGYEDDEFSGFQLNAAYAFSDMVAGKFTYYNTEHDDWSDLENNGFDLVGYFGTGLLNEGFKAYIGGGVYRETWEVSSFDETFSGFQLNGGIGYHWPSVTLDLTLGIRSTGEYEDFAEIDTTAMSSSLSIGYRF
ncbi:outer membrane beta-barrel protein [Thalassotalea mangrovi]|uniref:Porin family protein n=1 Tax=Thalassotalea mangrovi TaxID=2572245 RepID=A0A4U1B9J9_9GAMM|nr:outer membrane beta-barrel protein [Thalassotalea mangrovi]TKB47152.1 porin family protein [Thalassotalea mangrovi]